jgi:hypothetical protein
MLKRLERSRFHSVSVHLHTAFRKLIMIKGKWLLKDFFGSMLIKIDLDRAC